MENPDYGTIYRVNVDDDLEPALYDVVIDSSCGVQAVPLLVS